jgi:HEPN domain-containing protein
MDVAQSLFISVKKDLKAAERVYDVGLYPQSITQFQLCVEKANKAFGLINGIIVPDELHGVVKHDALAIYKKALDYRKQEIEKALKIAWLHPNVARHRYFRETVQLRKSIIEGQSFLDEFEMDKYFRLKEIDLWFIMDQLDDIRKSKSDIPDSVEEKLEPIFQEYLDFLGGIKTHAADANRDELVLALSDDKQYSEVADVVKLCMDRTIDATYVNYTLYFFALITIPHAIKSRYPMHHLKFDPNEFYNRRVPLVNLLPNLIVHMRRVMRIMPNLYKSLDLST